MTAASLAKPGTLVHARGREWVVLPESSDELLLVRPVGGLDEETTGILTAIESVSSATFPVPTLDDVGDFSSGKLLRDAARLSMRAAAGPFRSFGRIAVEPRPYQLVPLMMALKLDPVRLLIADDVGIGKTIEAALIARELLDRGEIRSFCVLCPPHLAEQWQRELSEKFHIEAELILSGTIQRLERDLPRDTSVFDRHRFTVVSTDFIKSTRRADDFVRNCPELVIVDEAHGCTLAGGVGRGRQQRFDLLRRITEDTTRHVLLVTATPHSGNEEAFRSLLSLLDPALVNLSNEGTGARREAARRQLAQHLVQRRRADIRHYLETDTEFPERKDRESTYEMSPTYRKVFEDLVEFAREYVRGDDGARRQRVRYWSALALLRCVSSSPAAAVATLRSRAAVDEAEPEEVEDVGRRTVLDQGDTDDVVALDFSPGSDNDSSTDATRRKLLEFARRIEDITIGDDTKLRGAIKEIESLLKAGFHPVVFCRFVDTADYVARYLREALSAKVRVESVTGLLPPAERETRIAALVDEPGQYVLVCTDCLSEGINLQQHFSAVLHYDLAWNPTRHEQREGRADRFGQKKSEVRVVTYYGQNNPIDGVILDVLIRKHKSIRSDLGVSVAVPGSSEQIAETLFEGALFREKTRTGNRQLTLDFIDDLEPKREALHAEWESARDREKASRSRYAQHTLSPDVVAGELDAVRTAIGRSADVERFLKTAMHAANVPLETRGGAVTLHINEGVPRSLRQALGTDDDIVGRFDLPLEEGDLYLGRTSPIVEGLASWVLDQALDSAARERAPIAARCGVIATRAVTARTHLLVARFRFHLKPAGSQDTLLCEEIVPLACTGTPDRPTWLDNDVAEQLLDATPQRNLVDTAIRQQLSALFADLPKLQRALGALAASRADTQLAAHERVREAARARGRASIDPVYPVEVLGAFILLPALD